MSKLPGTLAGVGEPQPNLLLAKSFIDQTFQLTRMALVRIQDRKRFGSHCVLKTPDLSFPSCLDFAQTVCISAVKVEPSSHR